MHLQAGIMEIMAADKLAQKINESFAFLVTTANRIVTDLPCEHSKGVCTTQVQVHFGHNEGHASSCSEHHLASEQHRCCAEAAGRLCISTGRYCIRQVSTLSITFSPSEQKLVKANV